MKKESINKKLNLLIYNFFFLTQKFENEEKN